MIFKNMANNRKIFKIIALFAILVSPIYSLTCNDTDGNSTNNCPDCEVSGCSQCG